MSRQLENELREMNQALIISSVQQHELAQRANQAEQAVSEALAYAEDIIATLREPFLILSSDLRVRSANRAFYELFQVSKDETEARLIFDLGNGQWDIPSLRTLLERVLSRSEAVWDFEVEHAFPVLGRKNMLLNARPFPGDSHHPEMILVAIQDVSVLRERADELAETSRRKDEFLATVAHELRNPLAPIRNAVQLLVMEGVQAADTLLAKEVILRQVTVMTRLVEDLIDMSRVSRNVLDIRRQPVDVATVMSSAVESSRPLITQNAHQLTVQLPPTPLVLHGDPVRLSQVFLNLLNNAAKYTATGGQIEFIAELHGSDAVIRVRDNGIGIPADMQDKVFNLFTQVDRRQERSSGGLGIGLTLARRLVEIHDGSIEVRSAGINQGSEFIVRLPILIAPPLELHTGQPAAITQPLSGHRILLVDDNRDSADSLATVLRLKENEVRTVYDGRQAVEAARQFRPELMLVDIGLPKLNGYEVALRIRQQTWGRSMILVALTGWAQDEDRARSRQAGFNFHLVQPVTLETLEALLSGVI